MKHRVLGETWEASLDASRSRREPTVKTTRGASQAAVVSEVNVSVDMVHVLHGVLYHYIHGYVYHGEIGSG